MSSSGSSPHPDDLLFNTPMSPASSSLKLPRLPPPNDFNGPLIERERERERELPPCVKMIWYFVPYCIGDNLKFYKSLSERIHGYLRNKLEVVITLFPTKASTSRKHRKKPKFKKVCNFYK
ncbi:hypothetical protein Bca4012_026495 [Brassica carinata]